MRIKADSSKKLLKQLLAFFLALTLALPDAFALRASEPKEDPRRSSGLEKALAPVGLEEEELFPLGTDLTGKFIGAHPFPVEVYGTAQRRRMYVVEKPGEVGIMKMSLPTLGMVHLMDEMGLSGVLPPDQFSILARTSLDKLDTKLRSNYRKVEAEGVFPWAREIALRRMGDLIVFKRIMDEAGVISTHESVQAAMSHLVGPTGTFDQRPTYRNLIGSVNHVLMNAGSNPRFPASQSPIRSVKEIRKLELWGVKEGGGTDVFQATIHLKDGRSVRLAVNVARDLTASAQGVEQAYEALQADYRWDPRFVMEPFGLGVGEARVRGQMLKVPVLVGEWLEDLHELHLYEETGTRFHVWWDQRAQKNEDLIPEWVSDQIWEQIIRIRTVYMRLEGDRGVFLSAALSAGDYVVSLKKNPDGSWERPKVMLVWDRWAGPPRQFHPSSVLLNALLVGGFHEFPESGRMAVFWWERPDRALAVARDQFVKNRAAFAVARGTDVTQAIREAELEFRKLAEHLYRVDLPRFMEDPDPLGSWDRLDAEQKEKALLNIHKARQAVGRFLGGKTVSTATGLEESSLQQRVKGMQSRLAGGDPTATIQQVEELIRLYHERELHLVALQSFESYLKEARVRFQDNPARFLDEAVSTLNRVRILSDTQPPEATFMQARESLGGIVSQPTLLPAGILKGRRGPQRNSIPARRRARVEKELAGMRHLQDHVTPQGIVQGLKGNSQVTRIRVPQRRAPFWQPKTIRLGVRNRAEKIDQALDALFPLQEYTLLEESPGLARVVPQAIFSEETPMEKAVSFFLLLQRVIQDPENEQAWWDLVAHFKGSSQGEAEVNARVPYDHGKLYLFSIPQAHGGNESVYLSFPPHVLGQVVRLTVKRDAQGRVLLESYLLAPTRLFRQVRWEKGSPLFTRMESFRQERLREVPQIQPPKDLPEVDPNRNYSPAEIGPATGIPQQFLDKLQAGGHLYREESGDVPGALVAELKESFWQVDRTEYRISSLQDFLGKDFEAVVKQVLRRRTPLDQRPGRAPRIRREDVLDLVIPHRLELWVKGHVGGFVSWREGGKILEIPFQEFQLWSGDSPFFDGFPLWVQWQQRRRLTRFGLQRLSALESKVLARFRAPGSRRVILLDEVKRKNSQLSHPLIGKLYTASLRAIEELGIPYRELKHPLAPVRPLIVVPRHRVDRILQEAKNPTLWTPRQIQPDRWYGVTSASHVLQVSGPTLLGYVYQGKLKATKKRHQQWIRGSEIRRWRKEQASAGLEEVEERAIAMERRFLREEKPSRDEVVQLLHEYHAQAFGLLGKKVLEDLTRQAQERSEGDVEKLWHMVFTTLKKAKSRSTDHERLGFLNTGLDMKRNVDEVWTDTRVIAILREVDEVNRREGRPVFPLRNKDILENRRELMKTPLGRALSGAYSAVSRKTVGEEGKSWKDFLKEADVRLDWDTSESSGLEEQSLEERIEEMGKRLAQGSSDVSVSDAEVLLRLFHSNKVRAGTASFDAYLKVAARVYAENPAGFLEEVYSTLKLAVTLKDTQPAAVTFVEAQQRLEQLLSKPVLPSFSQVKPPGGLNLAKGRAFHERRRDKLPVETTLIPAEGSPPAEELVIDTGHLGKLRSKKRLKEHQTPSLIGSYLNEHPEIHRLLLPVKSQPFWKPRAVSLAGEDRGKKIKEAMESLFPLQEYALLKESKEGIRLVPQAVFAKPTKRETQQRFRSLLGEAILNPEDKKAQGKLLTAFGSTSPGGGGVDMRVSTTRTGETHLVQVPGEGTGLRMVRLAFPRRFWGQVVRLVPQVVEGTLHLDEYALEPVRLFRQVRQREDGYGFVPTEPHRQELLREIPTVSPRKKRPRIDEKRYYAPSQVGRLTGISREIIQNLIRRGYLHHNSRGFIPGQLISLMAETALEIGRTEYPVNAVPDLLGMDEAQFQLMAQEGRFPLIHHSGWERLIPREAVLEIVLTYRISSWIDKKVGGFISWDEAGRILGMKPNALTAWPGNPPSYQGVPLWVRLDENRYPTRRGVERLLSAVRQANDELKEKGFVLLLDSVQQVYPDVPDAELGGKFLDAFRAVQELGIEKEILEDHPLAPIRTVVAVPEDRKDDIFKEVKKRTKWKVRQIQRDRWYGIPTVARVLGVRYVTAHHYVHPGKLPTRYGGLPSTEILGRHWVKGEDLLRFRSERSIQKGRPLRRKQGLSTGLEETEKLMGLLLAQGLTARLVWPQNWPEVSEIEIRGEKWALATFLDRSKLSSYESGEGENGPWIWIRHRGLAASLAALPGHRLSSAAGLEENPLKEPRGNLMQAHGADLSVSKAVALMHQSRPKRLEEIASREFDQYVSDMANVYRDDPGGLLREVGRLIHTIEQHSLKGSAAVLEMRKSLKRHPLVRNSRWLGSFRMGEGLQSDLAARGVQRYLAEHSDVNTIRVLSPRHRVSPLWRVTYLRQMSDQWRQEQIAQLTGQLFSAHRYALLERETFPGILHVVPQAHLAPESPDAAVRKFRSLVKQIMMGPAAGRASSRDRLLHLFGSESPEEGGITVRIGEKEGIFHLFHMPTHFGYHEMHLQFSERYWGQVVRLIPRWEAGELVVDAYRLNPTVLLRRFHRVKNSKGAWRFRRMESLRQERAREVPLVDFSEDLPEIEASRGFDNLEEISSLTAIPMERISWLDREGLLFRDPSGKIPGRFVAFLAQVGQEFSRQKYWAWQVPELLPMKESAFREALQDNGIRPDRSLGKRGLNLLNRDQVLDLAFPRRIRAWVESEVGGFLPWRALAEQWGISIPLVWHGLMNWKESDPIPSYRGVPFWIRFGNQNQLTNQGLEAFRRVARKQRGRIGAKQAVLLEAVKEHYRPKGRLARRKRFSPGPKAMRAFRAVFELGIPYRQVQAPIPFLPNQILVPRNRLKRIFEEADHPTHWRLDQIRPNRSYSIPAVVRVLSSQAGPVSARRVREYVKKNADELKVAMKLGQWVIPGRAVPALIRVFSGLEENPMDARLDWAQELMDEGQIREAVLMVLGVLEYSVLEGVPFLQWQKASQILKNADSQLQLGDQLPGFDNLISRLEYWGGLISDSIHRKSQFVSEDVKTAQRYLGGLLEAFHGFYENLYPSQFFRQYWYGDPHSGLEELPQELADAVQRMGPGEGHMQVVVTDWQGIPQVAVVQRVFVKVPEAAEISVQPVALVQKGLLPEEFLAEFERGGWKVETLIPEMMTKERLLDRVDNARTEWEGRPILVLLGTEHEELARKLPAYDRVTGIVLDQGFAATLGPRRLFLYLSETLTQYPGHILRVEYEVQFGRDRSFYVSTQL